MMKRLALALMMLLTAACAHAVDDITVTNATDGTITTVTYNWTSDGSGNAVGVTTTSVPGVIFSATTQAKSSAQPTNLYDVVVYEQFDNADGGSDVVDSSDDLVDGLLANRSNTANAVQTVRYIPNTVNTTVGKLRIQVSNAGASKQGTVQLLIGRGWYIKKGEASIPLTGGSTGQILQYQGPGAAKFVTMSGDATIADGGALTLAGSQAFDDVAVSFSGINSTTDNITIDDTGLNFYIGQAGFAPPLNVPFNYQFARGATSGRLVLKETLTSGNICGLDFGTSSKDLPVGV